MSKAYQTFAERFAERLRRMRIALGYTQEQLADAAGLHRTHVSLIERGHRTVRLETLYRISKALGVQPSSLIPPLDTSESSEHKRKPLGWHPDKIHLDRLFGSIQEYQALASSHGIDDIFQDNGGKLLQTLLILNLTFMGRREGNDAQDSDGNEYELMTVNIDKTQSFSTHHHLNPTILRKYRSVKAWFFSVYRGIELIEIYRITPDRLEQDYFSKWEKKWHESGGRDINNPKIPVSYIRLHGNLVYKDPANLEL